LLGFSLGRLVASFRIFGGFVKPFLAFASLAFAILATAPLGHSQFPPAPGTGPGLPETVEAIDSARVTTRILYITAHPDDESAAVLTYLARGLHAEVALLTLTRGEGGQNALGPEQAPQLGLIRTQELLAATRGYGVKLYFTRAKDFGYSKTPAETEKIWGDPVLEDMVRVIREFRPTIVINGWGGVHTGHGHHQTSGLWTPKAVALAADQKAFPEILREDLRPWNGGEAGVQILNLDRGSERPAGYVLPLDEVSPLWGKTWREIGIDAFANHRTQGIAGFLNSAFIRRPISLVPDNGKTFDPPSLAVGLTAAGKKAPCDCEEQMKDVDRHLDSARAAALLLDWPAAVAALVSAEKDIDKSSVLSGPSRVPFAIAERLDFLLGEREKVDRALTLAAGVELIADADRAELPVGDEFTITLHSRCRQQIACQLDKPAINSTFALESVRPESDNSGFLKWSVVLGKPENPAMGSHSLVALKQLEAEPRAALYLNQPIAIGGYTYSRIVPVTNTAATSTSVSRVPVRLVPAYTISIQPTQSIEVLNAQHQPFDILLRVHSYSTKAGKVSVGLDLPDGLSSTPPVELSFAGIGDQYAQFTVTPPAKLDGGNFTITAYGRLGEQKFSTSLEPLPSMPTILWSEPAQSIVHAFDINVPANLRVGYISAEGEPIPDALKRLGISVDLLDAAALAFGNLSTFDAIVVGVRAYELRPELAGANKRLLDYVSHGGTLIVQYNRDYVWDKLQAAPYPAKIGNPNPRITDENSPVKFLKPDDPLLNRPNKITQADFQNWVQERGLYFWSDFDSKYTALLAMNDPGEKDLNGALVYTRQGKGTYIYTGLAFFREIPEGVPGAYRLFVNLLCASRAN
jgi:LmbE family N-acetylglucosaminyl deacetylase